MQGLFERQIEVHGSWTIVGPVPGLLCQRLELSGSRLVETVVGTMAHPAADGPEKRLLIHRLIRPAVLQARRAISGEQQEGLTGPISLHCGWKKVGHRRAGRGDHGGGSPACCG